MNDEATIKRSLRIKTGVVKRLTKENNVYRKEIEDLRANADQLASSAEDSWEARNARNLVNETIRTLDLTDTKLKNEVGALRDLVASVEDEERIKGDECLSAAKSALEVAEVLSDAESKD